MKRRHFITTATAGVLAAQLGAAYTGSASADDHKGMTAELPELPWADDALEPYISSRTIGFHYGKHHQGYVKKINNFVKGTGYEGLSLEEIIKQSAHNPDDTNIFNNAAQVWNHTFYWHGMKPGGGGEPSGAIAERIKVDFGGYDAFRKEFMSAAGVFGSGWAWLVVQPDGTLATVGTSNAGNPMTKGGYKPLLVLDVWEHAYYLDYQNKRGAYAEAWLDNLVNWDFANANLASQ